MPTLQDLTVSIALRGPSQPSHSTPPPLPEYGTSRAGNKVSAFIASATNRRFVVVVGAAAPYPFGRHDNFATRTCRGRACAHCVNLAAEASLGALDDDNDSTKRHSSTWDLRVRVFVDGRADPELDTCIELADAGAGQNVRAYTGAKVRGADSALFDVDWVFKEVQLATLLDRLLLSDGDSDKADPHDPDALAEAFQAASLQSQPASTASRGHADCMAPGQIRVVLERVHVVKARMPAATAMHARTAAADEQQQQQPAAEAGTTHTVGYTNRKRAKLGAAHAYHELEEELGGEPFAVFDFYYRSLDQLRKLKLPLGAPDRRTHAETLGSLLPGRADDDEMAEDEDDDCDDGDDDEDEFVAEAPCKGGYGYGGGEGGSGLDEFEDDEEYYEPGELEEDEDDDDEDDEAAAAQPADALSQAVQHFRLGGSVLGKRAAGRGEEGPAKRFLDEAMWDLGRRGQK